MQSHVLLPSVEQEGVESYVMMQWKCDVHAVLPSFEQEWEQRDELNAL